jgi:hypothetical protein
MYLSARNLVRLAASAAFVALPLTACAAVGGGGGPETDCESDVSGSELTPVATADYGDLGESCTNNQFTDEDLDAWAYPSAPDGDFVGVYCAGDEDVDWRLFDVTDGTPELVGSGNCDGDDPAFPTSEGNRYVLVIDHPANSGEVEFEVFAGI